MLRILVTFWFDPILNEPLMVSETFDKNHPIPDFMKVTRVGAKLTEKGAKFIEFYDVEDGRLEEAMQVQYQREIESMKLIKGYKSNMEVLYHENPSPD